MVFSQPVATSVAHGYCTLIATESFHGMTMANRYSGGHRTHAAYSCRANIEPHADSFENSVAPLSKYV